MKKRGKRKDKGLMEEDKKEKEEEEKEGYERKGGR